MAKTQRTREGTRGVKHGAGQRKGWPPETGERDTRWGRRNKAESSYRNIDMPPVVGSFVSPAAADTHSEVHCLGIGVKSARTERFLVLPARLPAG